MSNQSFISVYAPHLTLTSDDVFICEACCGTDIGCRYCEGHGLLHGWSDDLRRSGYEGAMPVRVVEQQQPCPECGRNVLEFPADDCCAQCREQHAKDQGAW